MILVLDVVTFEFKDVNKIMIRVIGTWSCVTLQIFYVLLLKCNQSFRREQYKVENA